MSSFFRFPSWVRSALRSRGREFKAGRIENALEMFSKGLRYMDEHPVVPEDQPEELKNTFESLYVLSAFVIHRYTLMLRTAGILC